jgi:hypothetical protein
MRGERLLLVPPVKGTPKTCKIHLDQGKPISKRVRAYAERIPLALWHRLDDMCACVAIEHQNGRCSVITSNAVAESGNSKKEDSERHQKLQSGRDNCAISGISEHDLRGCALVMRKRKEVCKTVFPILTKTCSSTRAWGLVQPRPQLQQ